MVMSRGQRLTCRAGLLLLALLAIAPALKPGSAAAMIGPSANQNLSPRLAMLAEPAVRSASDDAQADKLGLADEGPGSLLRKGNRVLVYVRFARGAAAGLKALRSVGGRIVSLNSSYQTATVAAKPARLRSLGSVPRVAGVTEALAPVAAAGPCPSGEIVSEGDQQLKAAEARDEFLVDGTGVKVGILSDSFDQATEAAHGGPLATTAFDDIESGDLPGLGSPPGTGDNPCGDLIPVEDLEDDAGASVEEDGDEGRAMAQIVHDLAPKADIAFASAFNGEGAFANNIGKLATASAKVIVDDVFYLEEPFFQDGPVAVAVDEAVSGGVTYLSAAGNNSLDDLEGPPLGHQIGSWETPQFRDAGSCPPSVEEFEATHCLDFNPGPQTDRTFGIKVARGATLIVDLQWDEPWLGVGTDLDAFLLSSSGNLIRSAGEDNVEKSQKPLEVLDWPNESGSPRTVQLVVNRFSGGNPRLKFGLIENGFGVTGTEYPQSSGDDVVGPTVFGHSGTAAAISVGAVPFDDSSVVEPYSSRGPVRHDFGPVQGAEAAAALEAPEFISKPDIAATDCGLTTFFASFELGEGWRFCGTSAAAPHAAAVAGLMLGAKPGTTPAEVKAALHESAVEVSGGDPCSVGAGLVETVGAIEALPLPTGPTVPPCETPVAEVPPDEARAPGDWGSEVPPSTPAVPPLNPATPETPTTDESRRRPRTFFRQRPGRVIRTHGRSARVVLRFGSDQAGVSYACRIDGGFFRPCPERLVRRFEVGSHAVLVVARDASGNGDRTPAVFRFKVKRVG
jgi:subtilisin family serine protease